MQSNYDVCNQGKSLSMCVLLSTQVSVLIEQLEATMKEVQSDTFTDTDMSISTSEFLNV